MLMREMRVANSRNRITGTSRQEFRNFDSSSSVSQMSGKLPDLPGKTLDR